MYHKLKEEYNQDIIMDKKNGITITIKSQVRGGKNNMLVLRNGMHIPSKKFKAWRDDAVNQVIDQIYRYETTTGSFEMITEPCSANVSYVAGDRRRRDMPAIIDAVWHVLERAEIVKDDCLIENVNFKKTYNKESPQITITLTDPE